MSTVPRSTNVLSGSTTDPILRLDQESPKPHNRILSVQVDFVYRQVIIRRESGFVTYYNKPRQASINRLVGVVHGLWMVDRATITPLYSGWYAYIEEGV